MDTCVTYTVLVWAEIIFFLVSAIALYSGCRMIIMLIVHWYFSCYRALLTLSQGIFISPYRPASKEAGVAQETGRGQNQDS